MFIDEATIVVRSGSGGHGCVSFRREKFMPRGGPDGGSGASGGSVHLRANRNLNTLVDLSRKRHYLAENGRQGRGNNRTGRRGGDLTIQVPVGTLIRDATEPVRTGEGDDRKRDEGSEATLLGDLVRHGQTLLVARGGKGGRGNKSYASSVHQVPRISQEGEPGEERRLHLELRLLADVGLVGLPNAGKSTLLSRVSDATPKIADYPFTTLHPNLGIVELSDYRRLVVADIPGVIEGAHTGQGLGIEFLRHVERTRVLLHLVSVERGSVDSLATEYRIVERELACFSEVLQKKPKVVVASKIDLLPAEAGETFRRDLEARLGLPVLSISAVTGKGIRNLMEVVNGLVSTSKGGA